MYHQKSNTNIYTSPVYNRLSWTSKIGSLFWIKLCITIIIWKFVTKVQHEIDLMFSNTFFLHKSNYFAALIFNRSMNRDTHGLPYISPFLCWQSSQIKTMSILTHNDWNFENITCTLKISDNKGILIDKLDENLTRQLYLQAIAEWISQTHVIFPFQNNVDKNRCHKFMGAFMWQNMEMMNDLEMYLSVGK